MPNFSHGNAGAVWYLAAVYEAVMASASFTSPSTSLTSLASSSPSLSSPSLSFLRSPPAFITSMSSRPERNAGQSAERYLQYAQRGASFLVQEARSLNSNACLLPRSRTKEDRGVCYLGWCHGPPGTQRVFYQLLRAVHCSPARSLASRRRGIQTCASMLEKLTRGLLAGLSRLDLEEAPIAATEAEAHGLGLSDNVGQCCGLAGRTSSVFHHVFPAD